MLGLDFNPFLGLCQCAKVDNDPFGMQDVATTLEREVVLVRAKVTFRYFV